MSTFQPSANTSAGHLATVVDPWQKVLEHQEIVESQVEGAIARGVIPFQDRDSAIAKGQDIAYELAARWDVRNYEHLLRRTLRRRFMDKFRPGTDAIDRAVEEQNSNSSKRGVRPLRANLTAAEIQLRIDSRIPRRIQAIARMAMIEHLSFTQIAHRTGRSQPGPKAELKKIITYCIRRVYGQKTNMRNISAESIG